MEIKGNWYYLYRAVDSKGHTIDFLLSAKRDKKAVKRFIKKILSNPHATKPKVINTDRAPGYPPAVADLKEENKINKEVLYRPIQYLNNILEQDHRFIKWRIKSMLGFFSFKTANWIIQGIEAMHMIHKIQIKDFFKSFKNDKILFD